jgi:hypothetical protein
MNIPLIAISALTAAFLISCNPERGKPRKVQLENTAEKLEAKAGEVLANVEETAATKEGQANEIREKDGDEEAAEALEKDAEVTREVGKLRANQLGKQAEKARGQKE